jgi:hypothetical protein
MQANSRAREREVAAFFAESDSPCLLPSKSLSRTSAESGSSDETSRLADIAGRKELIRRERLIPPSSGWATEKECPARPIGRQEMP